MELSLFLAKALGLYFVVVSIAMLANPVKFRAIVEDIIHTPGIMAISAIVALIIGILLITVHNTWEWDWRLVITVLAWVIFAKGTFYFFSPTLLPKMTQKCLESDRFFPVIGILNLALGGFLLYHGYAN